LVAKVKEKTMANKKFWSRMLVMLLTLGMVVIGCETESAPEPEKHNKFYGTWVEAVTVDDISTLTDAEKSAGMARRSGGDYVLDNGQWYKEDYKLLWFYFEDSTYTYSTGSSGQKSTAVSYTFNNTTITTGAGSKPYTYTSHINDGLEKIVFKWDGKILTQTIVHLGSS
jgi:hypothetical protein